MQIYTKTSWACQNSIIYSKPDNPVFLSAIDNILENCNNEYYDTNPLCPTGPVLFGKSIAKYGESSTSIFGDYIFLTPHHTNKNPSYIMPDGLIFAFGKSAQGGDLTALGATGVNNYCDLYLSKQIYE